jgi:glycosyltransferase involved in cell wall biosynthesis
MGGYTLWCAEVTRELMARGHDCAVLTTRYQAENYPENEEGVFRLLHLEGDLHFYQPLKFFLHWERHQQENRELFERVAAEFKPDLVFFWGMWALSKSLPAIAEKCFPGKVAFYISDYWPAQPDMHHTYWEQPARHRLMHLPKKILGSLARARLQRAGRPLEVYPNCLIVSQAVLDILTRSGIQFQNPRVIHGGTDLSRFTHVHRDRDPTGKIRMLYAGQLAEHKGLSTIVQALAILINEKGLERLELTVVGSGHPDYEKSLHQMIADLEIGAHITFLGQNPSDKMPAILARQDLLLFSSTYDEPLARMTQEAMAAGVAVIGTTTGGTGEILVDGENGLTFEAGNAGELADKIAFLTKHPDIREQYAQAGRETIQNYFNLERMVDEIEQALQAIINTGDQPGPTS